MLDRNLPPLPYFATASYDEMFEALCLCYLANYSGSAFPTRTEDSFKRAWGMTTIARYPANGNGTPGFVIAIWERPTSRKVVVAIDGITSLFDVFPNGVGSAVNFHDLPGRVVVTWATFADTINATLETLTQLNTATERGKTSIAFAGWSAGAAAAELLAYWWNATTACPAVKLFKFGSPKVGNARWNANRARRVQKQNLCIGRDPIPSLPFMAGVVSNPFDSVPALWSSWQRDPDVIRWDQHGNNLGGYGHDQQLGEFDIYHKWLVAGYNELPWSDHDRRVYLIAAAAWADDRYHSLFTRLAGCEYPDAKHFLPVWKAGVRSVSGLFETVVGDPADQAPSPEALRELGIVQAPRPIIPQTTNPASGLSGGGDDWGVGTPERVVTAARRRRRR